MVDRGYVNKHRSHIDPAIHDGRTAAGFSAVVAPMAGNAATGRLLEGPIPAQQGAGSQTPRENRGAGGEGQTTGTPTFRQEVGEEESFLDRASNYKTLMAVKQGTLLLAFCWAHTRRDVLDAVRGDPEQQDWAESWRTRIGELRQRFPFPASAVDDASRPSQPRRPKAPRFADRPPCSLSTCLLVVNMPARCQHACSLSTWSCSANVYVQQSQNLGEFAAPLEFTFSGAPGRF